MIEIVFYIKAGIGVIGCFILMQGEKIEGSERGYYLAIPSLIILLLMLAIGIGSNFL